MNIVVMAGQIQLMTSGPQEKFFTIDPDYSHFVESFKKHSIFSRHYATIDPENEADFGKNVRFKIAQNQGDLLTTISVKMKLPQISPHYIESVGHGIIEYVDLIIGGKIIQHITSDYLQIYSEQNITQTKQYALEHLVGKYPIRNSNNLAAGSSDILEYNTLGLNSDVDFFVDIPFYFYRNTELALPLCAITKQEVEIEIKLRDAHDVVIPGATLQDPVPKIKQFELCAEVVFVDCVERLRIQSVSTDYLITQVQQDIFNVDADINEGVFKLDFTNPVKELYFVIHRDSASIFDYDNTNIIVNNKLIFYENLDYLTLTLDGEDIITRDVGGVAFLKAVQGAIHHSKTQLIRRFYSYSFALEPEKWYPTGQINFSLIKEQILKMNLTPCSESRQIRVYALSYNVLRISEGIAETLFNSQY
jgi:hypothetical protein